MLESEQEGSSTSWRLPCFPFPGFADFHGGWLAVGRVTCSLDVPVWHFSRPIGIFDMIYKEKSLLWATVVEVLVMIVGFM